MPRSKQSTRASKGRKQAVRSAARGKSAGAGRKSAGRRGGTQGRWSAQEDRQLRTLVRQRTPVREIVSQLGRTESAVRQHVYKLGMALRR